MQCSTCQATLPEAAKFCIECGAPAPCVCAACGFANPAHARSCAQCGAKLLQLPIAEPPAPSTDADAQVEGSSSIASGERRQLSVLIRDLADSTRLASRPDP